MDLTGRGMSFFGDSPTMRSLWIARRSTQWAVVDGSLDHSEGSRLERERHGSGHLKDGCDSSGYEQDHMGR